MQLEQLLIVMVMLKTQLFETLLELSLMFHLPLSHQLKLKIPRVISSKALRIKIPFIPYIIVNHRSLTVYKEIKPKIMTINQVLMTEKRELYNRLPYAVGPVK